jgi:hypothetical protein
MLSFSLTSMLLFRILLCLIKIDIVLIVTEGIRISIWTDPIQFFEQYLYLIFQGNDLCVFLLKLIYINQPLNIELVYIDKKSTNKLILKFEYLKFPVFQLVFESPVETKKFIVFALKLVDFIGKILLGFGGVDGFGLEVFVVEGCFLFLLSGFYSQAVLFVF